MNQEQYWRNLIADEISAEHDRVMTYYRKRGMNSGGMSNEEHTRLNIFKLCESIARANKNSPDFVPKESSPPRSVTPEPTFSSNDPTPVEIKADIELPTSKEEFDEINSFIEEQIEEIQNKEINEDVILNLIKDKPRQNQFGEFI